MLPLKYCFRSVILPPPPPAPLSFLLLLSLKKRCQHALGKGCGGGILTPNLPVYDSLWKQGVAGKRGLINI